METKYDPRLDSHPALSDSFEFRYSGQRPKRGLDAVCQVRIFERIGKPRVVVMTELPENEGMSVTNAVEMIIADLRQAFELPAETVWVVASGKAPDALENGQAQNRRSPRAATPTEELSLVSIGTGAKPAWKHLAKEDLFAMLDQEGLRRDETPDALENGQNQNRRSPRAASDEEGL